MPEEAATLYGWFLSSNHASDVKENTEITATGVVTYIGTDYTDCLHSVFLIAQMVTAMFTLALLHRADTGISKSVTRLLSKGTSIYSVMNT
jgi:hypothetical protein